MSPRRHEGQEEGICRIALVAFYPGKGSNITPETIEKSSCPSCLRGELKCPEPSPRRHEGQEEGICRIALVAFYPGKGSNITPETIEKSSCPPCLHGDLKCPEPSPRSGSAPQ